MGEFVLNFIGKRIHMKDSSCTLNKGKHPSYPTTSYLN